MPQKLLNNFIKLWQRGSNPRMEYLYIDYFDGEEHDEQIVMKGIEHDVSPLNRVRNFKSVVSNYSGPVYGGMDIYRVDGVKATIVFDRYETFSIWEMLSPTLIMAVGSKFPLFRLPQNEILRTIRVMNLEIIEPDMYWGMGAYGRKKKLTEPQSVLFEVTNQDDDSEDTDGFEKTIFEWKKRGSTMKAWLENLQNIFNYHKIDGIWFDGNSSEFDIDDVKEVFGNVTKVTIGITGCFAFNRSVLQHFFKIEKLTIMATNFHDSKIPPSLIMQNHSTLYIRENGFPTNIPLNDLLLINSKVIAVGNRLITPKYLNKFIKLWQKGSNPYMEILFIINFNAGKDAQEILMKGIQNKVIPDNRRRMFNSVELTDPHPVTGGVDIYRMDGTKATIRVQNEPYAVMILILLRSSAAIMAEAVNHLNIFVMVFYTIISWFSNIFGALFSNNSAGTIMARATTHPLLSLPDDEIIRKLRKMTLEKILKFSLISKRCKDLVTSLQINGVSFDVSISNSIHVCIETSLKRMGLNFYKEQHIYWGIGAHGRKKKLTVPQSVIVTEYISDHTSSNWTKNTLTMHYWLKHLQDIFNYPKIDCIWFTTDSSQFDIDDIKKVFGTATKVKIGNTGCYTFNQMILQNFLPVEKLSIKPSHFPSSKVAERILMQNFDGLEIGDGWVETRIMSLDQLLLINSKKALIYGVQISAKHFNKFIKLWQRGSNSQLERFAIHYTITNEEDGKEAIMKGIKHEIIPANQIRKFKATGNAMLEIVEGGIDIVRKDGVKATIRILENRILPLRDLEDRIFSFWEMCVWFDHCAVES